MTRKRRAILGFLIALGLLAAVMLILAFVDAEDEKFCAPTFLHFEWPKQWSHFSGCTLAAHDGLAAGLIGAAGAIWAAWLAYTAVLMQIGAERQAREEHQHEQRERIRRQQASAKVVAKVSILPAIRAASVAMFMIDRALTKPFGATESVGKSFKHLQAMLDSFGLRESVGDLAADDRVCYLEIIGLLFNLISVWENGHSDFQNLLKVLRSGFDKLHNLLKQYDLDLAKEFAGVSKVVPEPN